MTLTAKQYADQFKGVSDAEWMDHFISQHQWLQMRQVPKAEAFKYFDFHKRPMPFSVAVDRGFAAPVPTTTEMLAQRAQ